jgi:Cu+-exporting ATPase
VACPCALALTAPFTFGNILRLLGKQKFYLKNAMVIEQLAKVDAIVFDKTGTITTNKKSVIDYEGQKISAVYLNQIRNILRTSNHPLSRMLYDYLPQGKIIKISHFDEITGKGILAEANGNKFEIGSSQFVGISNEFNLENEIKRTSIHIKINGEYFGNFLFKNQYREGLQALFEKLNIDYSLIVLSGDNEGEKDTLKKLLPEGTQMIFNQKPEQKLEFIKKLQNSGKNVMMVGDGLNDAGALAQSNIGISISENVNVFSPACDAILDASEFQKINYYLKLSKKAITTIKMSFTLSLIYNLVGLSFALSGNLLPLVAAIIMPLSTITIVSFVTIMSNYYSKSLLINS